ANNSDAAAPIAAPSRKNAARSPALLSRIASPLPIERLSLQSLTPQPRYVYRSGNGSGNGVGHEVRIRLPEVSQSDASADRIPLAKPRFWKLLPMRPSLRLGGTPLRSPDISIARFAAMWHSGPKPTCNS